MLVFLFQLKTILCLSCRQPFLQLINLILALPPFSEQAGALLLLAIKLADVVVLYLPQALLKALVAVPDLQNGEPQTILHASETLAFGTQLVLNLTDLDLKQSLLSAQLANLALKLPVGLSESLVPSPQHLGLALCALELSLANIEPAFAFRLEYAFL